MPRIAGYHGNSLCTDTALETFGTAKLPIVLVILPANGIENAFIFVVKTLSVIDFVQMAVCNVQYPPFFKVFGQDKVPADGLRSDKFIEKVLLFLFRWGMDGFIGRYRGDLHIARFLYFIQYFDKGKLWPVGKAELDDATALNARCVRATAVKPFATLIPSREGWRVLLGFP